MPNVKDKALTLEDLKEAYTAGDTIVTSVPETTE